MFSSQRESIILAAAQGDTKALAKAIATQCTADDKNEALLYAAKCGQLDMVKLLFRYGVNMDYRDSDGKSAITHAVIAGRTEVFDFLVAHKNPALDILDHQARTLLMLAAVCGHIDLVKFFLEREHDVSEKDVEGKTAFLHAASSLHPNSTTMMAMLLEKKPELINVADDSGKTPLMYAAEIGNLETLNFLLDGGADKDATDSRIHTALIYAMQSIKNTALIERLVTQGADVNIVTTDGETALSIAILRHELNIIKILIPKGGKVPSLNSNGYSFSTILCKATKYRTLPIVEFLISEGARVNARNLTGETPLKNAINRSDVKMTSYLIANGAYVNPEDAKEEPLHLAAEKGHIAVMDVLLKAGADVNARDVNGRTPLMRAALHANTAAFTFLLKQDKVDIGAKDKQDCTVLYLATLHGKSEIVEILLRHSGKTQVTPEDIINAHSLALEQRSSALYIFSGYASQITPLCSAIREKNTPEIQRLIAIGTPLNFPDFQYSTPLRVAVGYNNLMAVECLISNGAIIDAADRDDLTPLMVAIKNGYSDIAAYLIEHRADVNATNKDGETPLMMAATRGDSKTINLLILKGAKLEASDKNEWTALTAAVSANYGNASTATQLIEHGANVNPPTKNPAASPLMVAASFKSRVKVIVLYHAGAKLNSPELNDARSDVRELLLSALKEYITSEIRPLFIFNLDDGGFNQRLKEVNTRISHLQRASEPLGQEINADIKAWIPFVLNSKKTSSSVEAIQSRIKTLIDHLAIVEKDALLEALSEADKKLAILRENENPNTVAFTTLKTWLNKKPADADIEKMMADYLLKPLTETDTDKVRGILTTWNADDRNKLKEILLDYVKKIAGQYKSEKTGTIELIQESYEAYQNSRQRDPQKPALFEILRAHHSGAMNQNTGKWKSFISTLETGKFKKTAPVSVPLLSRFGLHKKPANKEETQTTEESLEETFETSELDNGTELQLMNLRKSQS